MAKIVFLSVQDGVIEQYSIGFPMSLLEVMLAGWIEENPQDHYGFIIPEKEERIQQ